VSCNACRAECQWLCCELVFHHSKRFNICRLMESSDEGKSDKDDLDDEPPKKRANRGLVLSRS